MKIERIARSIAVAGVSVLLVDGDSPSEVGGGFLQVTGCAGAALGFGRQCGEVGAEPLELLV